MNGFNLEMPEALYVYDIVCYMAVLSSLSGLYSTDIGATLSYLITYFQCC